MQDGRCVPVLHIDDGVVIRVDHHERLKEIFAKIWPAPYGVAKGNKGPTLDDKSREHKSAFMLLIDALWPSTTQMKVSSLTKHKTRPEFHAKRIEVAVKYLRSMWDDVVPKKMKNSQDYPPFDAENVKKYITSTVSGRIFVLLYHRLLRWCFQSGINC